MGLVRKVTEKTVPHKGAKKDILCGVFGDAHKIITLLDTASVET
jgi:hypothetical protein